MSQSLDELFESNIEIGYGWRPHRFRQRHRQRMLPPDHETSREVQLAAARYLAEMAAELALVAHNHGFGTLGYLLEVARLEAERIARSSNGHGGT
jgi:hypothetical protein